MDHPYFDAFTKRGIILGIFLIALSLFLISCQDSINEVENPVSIQQEILSKANPQVRAVIEVQERHTSELMQKQDVVGTAVGLTEDGRPALLILIKTDTYSQLLTKGTSPIPSEIENIPVRFLVTGELKPYKGKPGGGGGDTQVSHTAIQNPPIALGTSGGWREDLANGYCCGGTLGSLIQFGGKKYILSNYHVLYADIVNGGNGKTAGAGDFVIQPGLIDVGCNANNTQNVARLVSGGGSLPGANIDAGVAEVISGMVKEDGSILEIGTISSSIINASIGQNVKKSGRTTGLTRSKISGLNATVSITYDNECAGGTAFTKTFTGQIIIDNKGNKFLNSGDSGSLMVEDATSNPKAVGLLYAGSRFTAIANPIGDVLGHYNATMVGN